MRPRVAIVAALAAALIAGCGSGGSGGSSGASSTQSTPIVITTSTSASTTTAPATTTTTTASSTTTTTATGSTSSPSGGVSPGTTTTGGAPAGTGFRVSSPAFAAGAAIPANYTCDGTDISPPVRWSGVPAGARELVLVMRDPDAPGGDFIHWALAGIPPGTHALPAGGVPGLVAPGRNSFGTLGYRGPCPPHGPAHHYVIALSALRSPSGLRPGFSAAEVPSGAIATATLTGTYARP